MTRPAISFFFRCKLSLISLSLLIPMAPAIAQSGAASLLESSPPSHKAPSATSPEPSEANSVETQEEAQTQITVAQLVEQGNDAYVNADYAEAIAAYTQALELHPQNAYAYYNRGNAYRKQKDHKAAFQDYTVSLRLNPENAYAYYYRGILFIEVEEFENALRDFSAALKLTDQNPLIYEQRGQIYDKLNNEDAAKEDYKKAIDLFKKQGKERRAELLRRKIGLTGQ